MGKVLNMDVDIRPDSDAILFLEKNITIAINIKEIKMDDNFNIDSSTISFYVDKEKKISNSDEPIIWKRMQVHKEPEKLLKVLEKYMDLCYDN